MDYKEKIQNDLKAALKAKDSTRLSTLRMVLASVKNKEVEKIRPLTDDEFHAVVKTMIKQHTESIESFKKGQRNDLAKKEEDELQILKEFVPAQMSEEELAREVDEAIKVQGAKSQKDMGKVMKSLMEKVGSRVDGRVLSDLVRKRLSS